MIRQFKSALMVNPECFGVVEQLESLFRCWDDLCQQHGVRSQAGVAYTIYTPCNSHWGAIDATRRAWWGESKPTSTFLVTNTLPDGRQWGNAKVAMEVVGIAGDCEKRRLYLYTPNNILTYCHAKVVEDDHEKIVFFSGVVALGSAWKDQDRPDVGVDSWVISPELDHQVYYCLRYIEELCRKAEIEPKDVRHIDIFFQRSADPSIVVKQVKERYSAADLFLRAVDGFFRDFKDPILVEIRPHAVAWKE